jgi:hypothetical protein
LGTKTAEKRAVHARRVPVGMEKGDAKRHGLEFYEGAGIA